MAAASKLVEMTADVVMAYVGNSVVQPAELPALIKQVHQALAGVAVDGPGAPPGAHPAPAVPVKRSITPDYLVCLEDGRRFKSLKRHLRTQYGMTPDQYRAKWGLPNDYPMAAPNYAEARSKLAKQMAFGQKVRGAARTQPTQAPAAKSTGAAKESTRRPRAPRTKAT